MVSFLLSAGSDIVSFSDGDDDGDTSESDADDAGNVNYVSLGLGRLLSSVRYVLS